MRVVLVGTSPLALATAQILIERRHDVVMIDRDEERISSLSETIDCGFIRGDGTRPAILSEAGPKETDVLFCLTHNDQSNILASLVGRSLGFRRVITKIDDPEFEHICLELSLTDTIVPDRHIAKTLADVVSGVEPLEVSTFVKRDVRLFSFVPRDEDTGPVGELKLPRDARVICIYRNDASLIPDAATDILPGDEVVLIVRGKALAKLRERWGQPG
jgi:trk system potassium uptake protein TrkA